MTKIEESIYLIRGRRVMFDADLAKIYGVSTKRLNQQVSRNQERFPSDFMFRLNYQEVMALRLQFATSKTSRGGRTTPPYVFTDYGAVMLANVLRSETAVLASIQVVRAFIKLREMMGTNKMIVQKLAELEGKVANHDDHIRSLFHAIRQMMELPKTKRKLIGFQSQ